MWEKLRIIFSIPELRQKILLTLGLLAVYRIGWWVQLPIVNRGKMEDFFSSQSNEGWVKIFSTAATFSATQFSEATIFGLGIMPYISASIIFQLLASVWKPLEELQKEGESGRKKINEYTRYATVVLCLIQSWIYVKVLMGGEMIRTDYLVNGSLPIQWYLVTVITMTTGTVFLMWLGEQIDQFGIGNGISLLIMAGILARMPKAGMDLLSPLVTDGITLSGSGSGIGVDKLIVLAMLFVAVVMGVVFITRGQRQIPTQSAKHVRGRRVYGGTKQYLPLRVNQAGVMPIIFASSLLMFPSMLFNWLASNSNTQFAKFWNVLNDAFTSNLSFVHNLMYVVLIYFFCYFWTAISFNPKDMAENLKSYGSFIPGHRPGRPTANYLEKVMVRITYVGAGFLALVAILPTAVAAALSIDFQVATFYGGTALLIAVSVAFDLVQKIDSHLVMRNYRGLLEKS